MHFLCREIRVSVVKNLKVNCLRGTAKLNVLATNRSYVVGPMDRVIPYTQVSNLNFLKVYIIIKANCY